MTSEHIKIRPTLIDWYILDTQRGQLSIPLSGGGGDSMANVAVRKEMKYLI